MNEFFDEVDDNPLLKLKEMFEMSNTIVYNALREPQVAGLLQSNETFDLLFLEIFLDDAFLGLAHHYQCPVVAISTMGATKWINDLVGSPSPISYVPSVFLPFTDRMSFWERLGSLLFNILEETLMQLYFYRQQSEVYEEYFAGPKPTLDELRKSAVSVALLNSHFSLSFPRPYLPGMVEVGGMQIEHNPAPLPEVSLLLKLQIIRVF
jgi:UDP-glucoronosyl and UDP-glucosyl transferase